VNLFEVALVREGEHDGFRRRGVAIGEALQASLLGGSVYELPPGETTFPFHFHYGVEEWLVVLAGRPTLRTPDGEQALDPWDTACFPAGPAGAHLVRNDTDEPARILMLSTKQSPSISVYPDSDKIGTRPGGDLDRLNFFRSGAVDYWAGE